MPSLQMQISLLPQKPKDKVLQVICVIMTYVSVPFRTQKNTSAFFIEHTNKTELEMVAQMPE